MVSKNSLNNELRQVAQRVRKEIMLMSWRSQSAHVGSALSCVELLVAMYFRILRVNPQKPTAPKRDKFLFSKAHASKALYAVLAERGFFDKLLLKTYEQDESRLSGHPTRSCVPGVEITAGSLGHGLSMGSGMAYAAKLDKQDRRIFVMLSDGECDEGSTWEAIMFAGHHKLDNLVAIVDYNKLQGFGFTKDVLDLEPISQKWQSFNWSATEIDGHDFHNIINALKNVPFKKNKPSVIIAHTIKGKGGSKKHEGKLSSHYKPPTEEELNDWLKQYF